MGLLIEIAKFVLCCIQTYIDLVIVDSLLATNAGERPRRLVQNFVRR